MLPLPHEVEPEDPGWTTQRILLAIATIAVLVAEFAVTLELAQ